MKRCVLLFVVAVLVSRTACAEKFFLADRDSEKSYGPFEFKQGGTVVINKHVYIILKAVGESDSRSMTVEAKMQAIRIPAIELRQVGIRDVMDFLKKSSVEFDDPKTPENQRGVNFILNLHGIKESDVPLVTFSAKDLTLMEALGIITETANMEYRIDGSVVFIEPKKEKKPQE